MALPGDAALNIAPNMEKAPDRSSGAFSGPSALFVDIRCQRTGYSEARMPASEIQAMADGADTKQ